LFPYSPLGETVEGFTCSVSKRRGAVAGLLGGDGELGEGFDDFFGCHDAAEDIAYDL